MATKISRSFTFIAYAINNDGNYLFLTNSDNFFTAESSITKLIKDCVIEDRLNDIMPMYEIIMVDKSKDMYSKTIETITYDAENDKINIKGDFFTV